MEIAWIIIKNLGYVIWNLFIGLGNGFIKAIPNIKWLHDISNTTWLKGILIYGGIPIGIAGIICTALTILFPTIKILKTKIFN